MTKLWSFLCLSVLACTVFYCSKDSDLISAQQSNRYPVSDSKAALKLKIKENVDKVLSLLVTLETEKHSITISSHQDQIKAINDKVADDLIELSKVTSESDVLNFIDNEVISIKSSFFSTPCFDDYARSYYRAVRSMVVCAFLSPGLECIYDYSEEFYAAMTEYENCINETYHSQK
jgi:hypothetical protein